MKKQRKKAKHGTQIQQESTQKHINVATPTDEIPLHICFVYTLAIAQASKYTHDALISAQLKRKNTLSCYGTKLHPQTSFLKHQTHGVTTRDKPSTINPILAKSALVFFNFRETLNYHHSQIKGKTFCGLKLGSWH